MSNNISKAIQNMSDLLTNISISINVDNNISRLFFPKNRFFVLQENVMVVLVFCFTVLADIEVFARGALVSDSDNRRHLTNITDNIFVNFWYRFLVTFILVNILLKYHTS